ncbi:cation transporter [Brachybacterium sacelli]|uniref:Divalent metal cation (Fe/Co/Zn/Cd) transporter n=1 Tax=Brachybacterium sacelli TaxID=173364 RepID=A0ABS4X5A9_9MICO|nr:cation transporter [Brachybacterium sacelli]MBP2383646.1 divalent metal cation (Fe/Co/Zn/Cd) transporter [Brachybacterium sacelli]
MSDEKGEGGEEATGSGHDALGEQQRAVLRRAIRLEWITLGWMSATVALVALVAGQSQAMRAAWAEDVLSLLPPIAFLVASRRIRKRPDRHHPYGHHRSIGVAHLVAAIALITMGGYLSIDSVIGLVEVERPPIGLTVIAGQAIWAGWLMVAVMVVTSIGPVILGYKKLKLSEQLHDKVLFADADMSKADWSTAVATIAGVLGIGLGLWWADAVAALVVAVSILRDGVKNLRGSIAGLTDVEARTYDDAEPHPLTLEIEQRAAETPWVRDVAARVRDEGHVFHAEVFVVPHPGSAPTTEDFAELRDRVDELDWKVHDIVIAPVDELPGMQTFRSTLRT